MEIMTALNEYEKIISLQKMLFSSTRTRAKTKVFSFLWIVNYKVEWLE